MAEDDDLDLGDLDMGDDDDDAVSEDEAEALEEAISTADGDGDDEELDPLAEEMPKMMEEEGVDDGSDSGDDVDQMMEMEMLKAMEEEGGGAPGAAAPGMAAVGGGGVPPNIERLMDVRLTVTIELGRTRDTLEKVMEYGDQSLIELDKWVGLGEIPTVWLQQNVLDLEDVRVNNTFTLSTKLSDKLSLKASHSLRFDNQPVEGFRPVDQTALLTLVATLLKPQAAEEPPPADPCPCEDEPALEE